MKPNETLLDLLLEAQFLDQVPRSGYVLRGISDPESVTEHSWHVLFLVWTLGPRIPDLDVQRAMGIALVHDLAEVRLGDLPRTSARYFPEGAKEHAESAAMAEILAPLPASAQALYLEYLERKTPESRLVKACDKLQLMIKVMVYEGWGAGGLGEFWNNETNFPDSEFEPVAEVVAALRHRHRQRTESTPSSQTDKSG